MENKGTRGTGILEGFLSKKRSNIANGLIPISKRKGSILDFGCGSYPQFLLNTDFSMKYGYDKSLEKGFYLDGIELIRNGDINKLPFKDNLFEVITMLAVFEHIEQNKLVELLSEFKRILKDDGVLIITTPCKWTDKLLRTLAKLNIVSKEEIEEHKGAYNHREIISYLTKAGFDKSRVEKGYFELFMNNWVKVTK